MVQDVSTVEKDASTVQNTITIISVLVLIAASFVAVLLYANFRTMPSLGQEGAEPEAEFLSYLLRNRTESGSTTLNLIDMDFEGSLAQTLSEDGKYDLVCWVYSDIDVRRLGDEYVVDITYRDSYEQELFVDNYIPTIIAEANITSHDEDVQKVRKICEYFKKNYRYDNELENDTPYKMLKSGEYTCQSASMVLYKVLTRLGIKCRLVTGTYQGRPHGWTQVFVDNKWSNLDYTLWAETGSFFLVNDKENAGHKYDDIYSSRSCE